MEDLARWVTVTCGCGRVAFAVTDAPDTDQFQTRLGFKLSARDFIEARAMRFDGREFVLLHPHCGRRFPLDVEKLSTALNEFGIVSPAGETPKLGRLKRIPARSLIH